jgi:hypothetical protein
LGIYDILTATYSYMVYNTNRIGLLQR